MALSEVPFPENSHSFEHPIDKFVDHYFAQKDLPWPELVDDRVLIRRIYLDLVGLPPQTQGSGALCLE